MHFSPPRLHPKLITRDEQKDHVQQQMQARALRRRAAASRRVADADENVTISLTTVSGQGSFDAWLDVEFPAPAGTVTASLLVDSGNTMMIIPNGEDLVGVAAYTILGTATEPWGCPANVVRGPVQIATRDGGTYSIQDCVFYACTGPNPAGERTANFGAGRVVPWSANPWNTPTGLRAGPRARGAASA